MTAYLLASLNVQDPSWVQEYQENVPAIVHKHGGEYLAVSETIKRYEGDKPDPDAIVLFTFPTMEAIDAFVSDADYEPYRRARRLGSSGDLLAFSPRD